MRLPNGSSTLADAVQVEKTGDFRGYLDSVGCDSSHSSPENKTRHLHGANKTELRPVYSEITEVISRMRENTIDKKC